MLVEYSRSIDPEDFPSSNENIDTPPFPARIVSTHFGSGETLGEILAVIDADTDGELEGVGDIVIEAEGETLGVTDAEAVIPVAETALGNFSSSCSWSSSAVGVDISLSLQLHL
ncbi:hypothetical protein FGB62_13g226 [Gracilaria domingensis]|nr:hypothetical protein FGB62_13g226 [Gracilaria domingensis]